MNKLLLVLYKWLDKVFFKLDSRYVRRSQNIKKIPSAGFRRGGKASLMEWSHVIGIFQTIIGQNVPHQDSSNRILDVGCGTGLLAIASEPHVKKGGKYVGLDVMKNDIAYCRKSYIGSHFEFVHHNLFNPTYSQEQSKDRTRWDVEDNSFDLVTALSVWTHLNEEDAIFYFKEISRVLNKGGKALITFFVLDENYNLHLINRKEELSSFHNTSQTKWIFDKPAYSSTRWFTAKWVKDPEDAIGVNMEGIEALIKDTDLKLTRLNPGTWREQAGVYFQDVLIFEKK